MSIGDIELSATTLVTVIIAIFLIIAAIIFFFKFVYIKNKQNEDLASKYDGQKQKSPLIGRTKFPDLDVFRFSSSFFLTGLLATTLLVTSLFAYTQYEPESIVEIELGEIEEDIDIAPPRTSEPPPPPPPPPPPVIEEVPEEEIEEEEQQDFVDQSIDEETVVEAPEIVEDAPPPPPPPPPKKEPKVEEIFKVVEQMPSFPGCEDISDKKERESCATTKLLKFLSKNIKYPTIASENGVEGNAVITFVVERDGSITDAKILRDPGAGTGEEALRVVNLMNNMKAGKWNPGKQRGEPVRVQFNLPVRFKLQN